MRPDSTPIRGTAPAAFSKPCRKTSLSGLQRPLKWGEAGGRVSSALGQCRGGIEQEGASGLELRYSISAKEGSYLPWIPNCSK